MANVTDLEEYKAILAAEEAFDAIDDWFDLHDHHPPETARRIHRKRWPGVWKDADRFASKRASS